ncbi:ABC transporter permease [Candidatus Epulonipiscium viviparus]|uniref:ABC transporter permease n=1 Tax=Candidatus Epulonipiscium viviparus TaxID=420336 RepID=UPI0027380417|nr:iron export ABC transporter permease subunit FetB [Candidatus Epulopiscium viviparus]
MSIVSLMLASLLVLIPVFISMREDLDLHKQIAISVVRAAIQLTVVGSVLQLIFGLENMWVTLVFVAFMIFNAAMNVTKLQQVAHQRLISYAGIGAGTVVTLAALTIAGVINFTADEVIPICGMIVNNAMVAVSITYRQMQAGFIDKREEIETKLSLGAPINLAAADLIKRCLRAGMLPTIDAAKALGIVALPGMMTGLILGGSPPLEAIKYQLMVTFMLLSATSIATFIITLCSYRSFFNKHKQLNIK